jgi:hypothetical protein
MRKMKTLTSIRFHVGNLRGNWKRFVKEMRFVRSVKRARRSEWIRGYMR